MAVGCQRHNQSQGWLLRSLALVALGSSASAQAAAARKAEARPNVLAQGGEIRLATPSIGPAPNVSGQSVELLRFVTAYRAGLEAAVDLTPFSPLLHAAADDEGALHFYSFIDTWVDNQTHREVVYVNRTGECEQRRISAHGNGWDVTADLVFWPRANTDTRPHASVTLASGCCHAHSNSDFPFGVITVHEGRVNGTELVLEQPADLRRADATFVFGCPGGQAGLRSAGLAGYMAQVSAGVGARPGKKESAALGEWRKLALQNLLYPEMRHVTAVAANSSCACKRHNATLLSDAADIMSAGYDNRSTMLEVGMPVYLQPDITFTAGRHRKRWRPYPLEPVGHVVAVHNGTFCFRLRSRLDSTTCHPHYGSPAFVVPSGPGVPERAAALLDAAERWGRRNANTSGYNVTLPGVTNGLLVGGDQDQDTLSLAPLLLVRLPAGGNELHRVSPRGWLRQSGGAEAAPGESNQRRYSLSGLRDDEAGSNSSDSGVCAVAVRRQGKLFSRSFVLPRFAADRGDRVVLQLVVTGHSWLETSAQCGEFCHAIYRLTLNGVVAANVTEFRSDCDRNPIDGKLQHGTWNESRNGWCPGSVEPGVYLDVTEWLRPGANELDFAVLVWDSAAERYTQYVDYAGFAFGVGMSFPHLVVGLTAFVYGSDAVHAIRRQPRARTAAESALRHGCSHPEALTPPDPVREAASRRLVQPGVSHDIFREEPPWYAYNASEEGPLGGGGHGGAAKSIRIFDGVLMQGNSRLVKAVVNSSALPAEWGRVALWLRLSKPPGKLDFDHWDRMGSLGLYVRPQRMRSRVSSEQSPRLGAAALLAVSVALSARTCRRSSDNRDRDSGPME